MNKEQKILRRALHKKKLREKRKREKREKRERDGLYFKIFNIFSNSFFSVILHFFEGYKIWNTQLS